MNGGSGKGRYQDVVVVEWREVPPPRTRMEIITAIFLGIMFIGGAIFAFLVSGLPNWWELTRYGEEAQAHVIDLEFMITPGQIEPGDNYDRLTVTFLDRQKHYQKVIISDGGRFARDHRINRHNPRPSLPKETSIVYSRRHPEIAELRDYRLHSWWMAGFSLLVAAMFPAFLYLAQREKRRSQQYERWERR